MRSIVRALPFAAAVLLAAGPAFAATDVPLAPFSAVGLEGGGHVTIKQGPVQKVTLLKGSTRYTTFTVEHGSLKIDTCNSSCPHQYDLDVEITVPKISAVAISGGGDIDSRGNFATSKLAVAVHGGGSIDIRSIAADQVSAAVDGGGEIQLTAKRALSAAVNGGGEIAYWGNPSVSSAINGGGDVHAGS